MKAQRLKTREQFQAVLAVPPLTRTEHFVMHRRLASGPDMATTPALAVLNEGLWFGAMVPKRWARRAVTRNLIKRQIFSLAEQYAPGLPVTAYLIRLRSGFDRQQFKSAASDPLRAAVRKELEQLFRRAIRPEAVVA